ncbi:hypothetical protein DH2020_023056 [Rehmannia glutinosa]|uniref:Ubiquitin-like domain-containing protein n=1 Tax=Rehmannia glutinosa TaxID=99300 RepID=A0ABR0W4Y5_REHGL
MEAYESGTHQVFVKLLDGKHKILNFTTPSITVSALKHRIQTLTSIPSHLQLLLFNDSRVLHDHQTLNVAQSRGNLRLPETLDHNCNTQTPQNQNCNGFRDLGRFPVVVHLLLRLRGGKGGFGSLLRGAATKAGQKKTNNFDACRDMSGRRLRHVNAEKKLEEWRAEAEERKLEKMAEEYIKKKTKEVVKSGKSKGGDSAEKYVAKYREDSAKCMEEVDRSVRESIKGLMSSKRKSSVEGSQSDSKRLKIWYGKRKLGDSDSEDGSDEAEGSSGSLTGRKLDAGSLDQGSSGSGSEEEDAVGVESFKPDKNLDVRGENGIDFKVPDESDTGKLEEINSQLPGVSCSEEEVPSAAEVNNSTMLEPIQEEAVSVSVEVSDLDKPLNFDEYHSVAELEVLESGPVFVLLSLRITNSVQEFNLYSYSPPPAECGGRATAAVADTGGASTASESELIAFLRAIDFATLNKQIADNMGTVAKDGPIGEEGLLLGKEDNEMEATKGSTSL